MTMYTIGAYCWLIFTPELQLRLSTITYGSYITYSNFLSRQDNIYIEKK